MIEPKLRRYKYLWAKCQDRDVILAAWRKLRKGKTKRREVQIIEADFDHYVDLMIETLKETRPGGDPEKQFTPSIKTGRVIYEHGKERRIYCPSIWEQWVHHIVVQVLSPIITKHAYRYSCGSMPNRGSIYGKRYMERLTRKGFRHFAKLDIRHFFNNVRLDVVIKELEALIEDSWLIYLIRRIFLQFPKGLPLGFYISQWLANFVLRRLDRIVLDEKPMGFVRYMDDMVVIDNNKRHLHQIVVLIKKMLGSLRLKLKDNWTVARFTYKKKNGQVIGRPVDFMGFVFTRKNTILRKSIMIRATRFARKLSHAAIISSRQALSMVSRAGWFKHTDTRYVWEKYIKGRINIKALKNIISKYQRRLNDENKMVRGALQLQAGAV